MAHGISMNGASAALNLEPSANDKRVILVTGGTGLVGMAIQKLVLRDSSPYTDSSLDQFHFCGSKDADLRDLEQTKALFETIQPTHVLHAAALTGGLYRNMRHKVEFFRDNMAINDSVLYCARVYNVQKLISCLSTCVFPDKTTYPIDESMLHQGEPHASNRGYAMAKRMIDTLNHCYHDQFNCVFTSVIPTNVYGPHDNFCIKDAHVIPGLMHKCYLAKKENTPFVIFGSGKPLRQFIHSEDLAELMLFVLQSYDSIEPIILSPDPETEIAIKDIALLIAKAAKFEGLIVFDESKADGQLRKTANNAKLRALMPDFRFRPIETGIAETYSWFKDNFAQTRT